MSSATAKSLQLCPTLCDPIDSSPPGSRIPGILQARTLEWIAISFSNAWKWKVKGKSLSHVQLLATPWTVAHQAPPSMGFSRKEYLSLKTDVNTSATIGDSLAFHTVFSIGAWSNRLIAVAESYFSGIIFVSIGGRILLWELEPVNPLNLNLWQWEAQFPQVCHWSKGNWDHGYFHYLVPKLMYSSDDGIWFRMYTHSWRWRSPGGETLQGIISKLVLQLYFLFLKNIKKFTQSCPTLCDHIDCITPGFPVHHQLLELAQTHVHWVGDSIQPFHPLLSPFPPAFNLSQH